MKNTINGMYSVFHASGSLEFIVIYLARTAYSSLKRHFNRTKIETVNLGVFEVADFSIEAKSQICWDKSLYLGFLRSLISGAFFF